MKKIKENDLKTFRNILILCFEYPPLGGGGAKVVSGLTREFQDTNFRYDLVTMGFKDLPSFERDMNLNIHRTISIRHDKSVCYVWEMIPYLALGFLKACRIYRKKKPALTHAHFIFPDGIIAYVLKKVFGLSYIITAHGSDVPGYNPDRFQYLHRILAPLWKRVTADADLIVCPSKTIDSMVIKNNSKAKTTIIPNGISIDRFNPNREKQKKILVVTRMFKRKGVQYFLEALRGLDFDFEVNIVGDGLYLKTLKRIASKLNIKANFHGYLDPTTQVFKELFETSRIFVFTSEAENFPIVLLEAMVAGMAIITTKGTGCNEVIGDTGINVPARDPNSIREALVKLILNPELCQSLGEKARKRVEEHFTWNVVGKKYLEIYSKMSC